MDPPRRKEMTPAWTGYCDLFTIIARNTWGNQVVNNTSVDSGINSCQNTYSIEFIYCMVHKRTCMV